VARRWKDGHEPHLLPEPPIFYTSGTKETNSLSDLAPNATPHHAQNGHMYDVARNRTSSDCAESLALAEVLASLPPRSLVVNVKTDGLFTTAVQRGLAAHILCRAGDYTIAR